MIGDEARAQILEREGRLPDRVIACVGGGSNAIGIFAPFVGDEGVALIGVEAGGEGARARPPRRAADRRRAPGVLHGSLSARAAGREGQILEAHSISAGLDYPGSGPEHAYLRDIGRATLPGGHRRRGAGDVPAASRAWRGSSPRSRPPTPCTTRSSRPTRRSTSCAARGAATRTWPRSSGRHDQRGRDRRAQAIAAAFAGEGRAALMPYMMGGFPDMETSRRVAEAYADGGADLVELGFPFSDPLADGPVDPRGGDGRAARRGDHARGARRRAGAGRARPGRGHGLREPRDRARPGALRRRPRRRTGSPA